MVLIFSGKLLGFVCVGLFNNFEIDVCRPETEWCRNKLLASTCSVCIAWAGTSISQYLVIVCGEAGQFSLLLRSIDCTRKCNKSFGSFE